MKRLTPLFATVLLLAACSFGGTTETPPDEGATSSTVTEAYGETGGEQTASVDGMPQENPGMMEGEAMSSEPAAPTGPFGYDGVLLSGKHVVTLRTSMGPITIELDADAAPKAVTNFLWLAKAGYYDGLKFHRVIPGFMIQGGDPNGNGTGGESIFGETFEDESNDLQMVRGALAMANRGPDTNGSQFFIVQAEATPWLQGRHTIFGRVTEGMDIVDSIANTPRDARDLPLDPVTFKVELE